MQRLATEVSMPPHNDMIDAHTGIITIGSCFADHIGGRLREHGFITCVNPFGTVFNPISMARLLHRAIEDRRFVEEDVHRGMDRFFCFELHSTFAHHEADQVIHKANTALEYLQKRLQKATLLMMTFGTSIVYHHRGLNMMVNNCHKVPNQQFERRFLKDEDMASTLRRLIELLSVRYPQLQIVTTVSPVRHTREGLIDNSVSKARLLNLCNMLQRKYGHVHYFPAYEVMMDELRDYRYYESDLIHPTGLAIDIIWERFCAGYFTEKSIEKRDHMIKLNRAVAHRPFHAASDAHQRFCRSQLETIDALALQFPEMDLSSYRQHFSDVLLDG